MKLFSSLILFLVLSLTSVFAVHAQTANAIWIQANTTSYKTNETAIFTINAVAGTPIQGFTAQVRYDPTCLKPENSTSPIAGMNGLALPQGAGLVDISFASTTPVTAIGTLAEVRFTTLKGCQTSLNMESAALVVRNESGFAVSIPGVTINQNTVALNIDSAVGVPQPEISGESVLPLAPTIFPKSGSVNFWKLALMVLLAAVPIVFIVMVYRYTRPFEW